MPTVLISSPFDAYGGNEPYVFVSYAHIDAAAVYPEIKKMHHNGVRIWYDKGIEEGSEWPAEIEKALNNCTVFIVFLSKHAVESVNIRNEIHLALKKKKEFLAVYLEKTDLKFGLELTISSLQHVTKRQTGEYWEKIWKFLTTHPEVFDSTKSQNVFTSTNQSLVFNNDGIGLIDKYQDQSFVFSKFTNKQKYFGLGVVSLLAMGIFAIAALLFFGDKTSKDPAISMVSNTTLAKNKNDSEVPKTKELAKTPNNKNSSNPLLPRSNTKDLTPIRGSLLLAPFNESVAKEKQNELAKILQTKVLEVEDLGKGLSLEMVLIPAGKFMMGSPASEQGRFGNETQHEVTITKPYFISKYEVTQDQWQAIMGNNPSRNKGANLPVDTVSWNQIIEFVKKLNVKTGGVYRLPTEAEWEYACRAGTTTAYSFGDGINQNDGAFGRGGGPSQVGSYKPNFFGLYDMHGNVWEWCEDWVGEFQNVAVVDPTGPENGKIRVARGGSFDTKAFAVRSSSRFGLPPTDGGSSVGFRLAKTVNIKTGVSTTVTKPDLAVVIPATENLLTGPFTETKAKAVQKEVAKSLKKDVEEKADLGNGINLEMVLIPAGKFMMGSPESEAGRKISETLHEVTITKSYYMGKHEVTQEQWQAVMGNNPSDTKGENLPVNNVSWNECQEFIKKLNANTNGGYRLPTEAEWEYACRAGTSTTYSFGVEITPKDANYVDSKIGRPVVVGSYKPNSFGLFDMHGNVWEWCENKYGGYPSGAVTDPQGPATGTNRGMRGGSFLSKEFEIRYSSRNGSRPTDRDKQYGIRLAKTSEIKIASSPTLEKNVKKQDSIEVITPTTETILVAPFTETKAKQVQKVVAKNLQKKVEEVEDLGDGIQLDLILIPGGKFKMGSPAAEKGRFDNETQHEVTLTKPYYLGKHEVTQEQWEAVMGSNPSDTKGEKLPVTNISWNDCQEFITKLNLKKSGGYRLPTEEEWEYACRAGTNSAYSFGDNITPNNANCDFSNIGKPAEVGSYKPNSFGLYDMHGNVFEWCEDGFREYTAAPAIGKNKPVSPPEVRTAIGIGRVLRGGSFSANVSASRSSNRAYLNRPTDKHDFIGFRLARNISEKDVLFPAPVIKQ